MYKHTYILKCIYTYTYLYTYTIHFVYTQTHTYHTHVHICIYTHETFHPFHTTQNPHTHLLTYIPFIHGYMHIHNYIYTTHALAKIIVV